MTNEIIDTYLSIKEAARLNNTSDVALYYTIHKNKTHIFKNYKWVCEN